MNVFDHEDLGNHLLQLCPKVVKHPVYTTTQTGQLIRPVVNWPNAPAYKLSKLFTHKINSVALLPSNCNIKNTTQLLQNLRDTPIHPHFTFASLDFTNLYSNIPTKHTKKIFKDTLKYYQTEKQTQQELLIWYDIITIQNYFTHKQDIISQ